MMAVVFPGAVGVTLRVEGVDEILNISLLKFGIDCHPPCGGCGLKWWWLICYKLPTVVTLRVEGVD